MKDVNAMSVSGILHSRSEAISSLNYLEGLGMEGLDYISLNGIATEKVPQEVFYTVKSLLREQMLAKIAETEANLRKLGVQIVEDN